MTCFQHHPLNAGPKSLLSFADILLFRNGQGGKCLIRQRLSVLHGHGVHLPGILFEEELFAVGLCYQLLLKFGLPHLEATVDLLASLGIVVVLEGLEEGLHSRLDQGLHILTEGDRPAGGQFQISGLIGVAETMQIAMVVRNGFCGGQTGNESFDRP